MKRGFLILLSLLAAASCKDRHEITSTKKTAIFKADLCGGYPKGWRPLGSESGEFVVYNELNLGVSGVRWNGASIDDSTLRNYLIRIQDFTPTPVTALVIDDTVSCLRVDRIRAIMNEFGHCNGEASCVEYSSQAWLLRHPPNPY